MEIQLRILGFAMRCSHSIIDPLFKARNEHLTKDERAQRKELPVGKYISSAVSHLLSRADHLLLDILATCKAYHEEGTKLFFNNSFVFTQVAALENFARVSSEIRSTIKHVTLRVVGRYYDDEPSKRNILNTQYHPSAQDVKIQVYSRPKGAYMDKGIHSYCWQQLADFLKNLQVPTGPRRLSKLFPSLRRMRVDLVNFSDHLHYPGPGFATILRWHTGEFLDELIMTGIPDDGPNEGPEQMFTRILKDEGVFASGPPIFISQARCLKPLPPLDLAVRCVRADEDTKIIRSIQNKENMLNKRVRALLDPADGKPPKSFYPPGRTIWKFTQDSLRVQERRWIEFDRESGYPADDIDMWSDMGDSVIYDSEGNPIEIDSDGNPIDSDEDMDDDMPALLAV
jgi:hypothetical protein